MGTYQWVRVTCDNVYRKTTMKSAFSRVGVIFSELEWYSVSGSDFQWVRVIFSGSGSDFQWLGVIFSDWEWFSVSGSDFQWEWEWFSVGVGVYFSAMEGFSGLEREIPYKHSLCQWDFQFNFLFFLFLQRHHHHRYNQHPQHDNLCGDRKSFLVIVQQGVSFLWRCSFLQLFRVTY